MCHVSRELGITAVARRDYMTEKLTRQDISGREADLLSPHYKLGYAQASLEQIVQELVKIHTPADLVKARSLQRVLNLATDALVVVRRTE